MNKNNQVLIDTNILVHSKSTTSPDHEKAKADLVKLVQEGNQLFVCPQVLREFYKVMTTPTTANGLGLTPEQAHKEVDNIVNTYDVALDSNQVFIEWQTLVNDYKVSGKNAHDTNIVACMTTNGIKGIITYNHKDFKRFNTLISLHP